MFVRSCVGRIYTTVHPHTT